MAPRVYIRGFCGHRLLKCLAYLLIVVSITSIILDIVDVALTYKICPPSGILRNFYCLASPSDDVWTWVASGIWASVPLTIAGIWTLYMLDRLETNPFWYVLFLFVCTFFFTPAKIILNSIEASKYGGVNSYWEGSSYAYSKLVIPIFLAVFAFLEHIHCLIFFINFLCCWWTNEHEERDVEKVRNPSPFMVETSHHKASNNMYQYQVPFNMPINVVNTPAFTPRYVYSTPGLVNPSVQVVGNTGLNLNNPTPYVQFKTA
ncbi:hypothetical protein HELRODRAFT_189238 [Helobdella robusta]|uniref:Uncharacterized protein n=1 Tax=Helobdella robusta TaxID=6412 RepID=T1FQU7_HELRO|nr:hypothetical protein HELRODRAFT_189238 [Helobdella robusta]ESN96437.1 hypothetical protein HELRODRAFT_189238 [Helobdella robusta]